LFSYHLKKPHRNSLEGLRERLKTLMLQTKMNALYTADYKDRATLIFRGSGL
jgi:hypothetical protein